VSRYCFWGDAEPRLIIELYAIIEIAEEVITFLVKSLKRMIWQLSLLEFLVVFILKKILNLLSHKLFKYIVILGRISFTFLWILDRIDSGLLLLHFRVSINPDFSNFAQQSPSFVPDGYEMVQSVMVDGVNSGCRSLILNNTFIIIFFSLCFLLIFGR
jgi:hypothetical protein